MSRLSLYHSIPPTHYVNISVNDGDESLYDYDAHPGKDIFRGSSSLTSVRILVLVLYCRSVSDDQRRNPMPVLILIDSCKHQTLDPSSQALSASLSFESDYGRQNNSVKKRVEGPQQTGVRDVPRLRMEDNFPRGTSHSWLPSVSFLLHREDCYNCYAQKGRAWWLRSNRIMMFPPNRRRWRRGRHERCNGGRWRWRGSLPDAYASNKVKTLTSVNHGAEN